MTGLDIGSFDASPEKSVLRVLSVNQALALKFVTAEMYCLSLAYLGQTSILVNARFSEDVISLETRAMAGGVSGDKTHNLTEEQICQKN
jgi:hypothetical protein